MRKAIVCVSTESVASITYRRFGTTCRTQIQESITQILDASKWVNKIVFEFLSQVRLVCFETVQKLELMTSNTPEDQIYQI